MFIVIALVVVLVGTVAFHFWSPWWWTPIASNWGFMDTTITITFWITGVVFIAVLLFMIYCLYKFRYVEGRRSEYQPENEKLEWWLTIGTAVGVCGMLIPGLFVWYQFVNVPDGAAEVEVVGQQWQWTYRFPGKDGVLGKTDIRKIDDDNPFGLDPDDPNGRDDVLIDDSELHLPIGKPVKLLLRALDVLHDFAVVEFRAKMDMVPGTVTYYWLTPIRTGTFDVLCFELCGVGHYTMRGNVVVESEADFKSWLAEQPTFAQTMADAAARKGKRLPSNPVLSAAEAEISGTEKTVR